MRYARIRGAATARTTEGSTHELAVQVLVRCRYCILMAAKDGEDHALFMPTYPHGQIQDVLHEDCRISAVGYAKSVKRLKERKSKGKRVKMKPPWEL